MQNRSFDTKSVVEAGLTSALIVILAFINAYIPGFSLLGTFLLPIPVTVLYIKHNFKVALSAVVVSGILVGLTYDPIRGLTSSIIFGLTGLTLGYCIKKDKKVSITIILLGLASTLGTLLDYTIYLNFIDKRGLVSFIQMNIKMINEAMNQSIKLYSGLGMTADQMKPMQDMINLITTDFILKLIPSILICGGLVSAFLSYIITKSILKKLRISMRDINPLTEIYLNTRVAVSIVTALLLGIVMSKYKVGGADYVTTSAQIILQFALLIDGISLITFYLRRKFRLSKPIIILIVMFTAFSQPFSLIYLYAGLADIVVDFRKLDPLRHRKIE